MRTRDTVVAAVALAAALAAAACGSDATERDEAAEHEPVPSVAYDPAADTSTYGHRRSTEAFDPTRRWRRYFEEEVTLADGRRVRLWYSEDGGALKEQHFSPRERSWTEPRELFRSTEPDPCQGIELVARGDLVAAIADFALWCYDGEPPEDAVAAVSYGDLTDWRVEVEDVDGAVGWTKVAIDDEQVRWTDRGETHLSWTPTDGFTR
ncbi:hypothetical protein [Nocardioides sp. TF02-7]|uniref:hypothetical protein n=1 Tax=Nocardioides sp. TF02-7 TaxID=2917724 RepID=UPI001F065126|nr:hypothetical protein [Nocardioides sp. TF02-7]UMG94228.1 hypothetical protein MF408_09520 [Nocardioides sp. TF02-7]